MRVTDTGRKVYQRKGIEGYSLRQIAFAQKIKQEAVDDFFMRMQHGEMTQADQAAWQRVIAHKEAGWWIARRHWSVWRLIREQREGA
jgi:uncharacterized protein YpbB